MDNTRPFKLISNNRLVARFTPKYNEETNEIHSFVDGDVIKFHILFDNKHQPPSYAILKIGCYLIAYTTTFIKQDDGYEIVFFRNSVSLPLYLCLHYELEVELLDYSRHHKKATLLLETSGHIKTVTKQHTNPIVVRTSKHDVKVKVNPYGYPEKLDLFFNDGFVGYIRIIQHEHIYLKGFRQLIGYAPYKCHICGEKR